MKKILSIVLCAVLLLAAMTPVYAEKTPVVHTKLGVGMSVMGFSSINVVTGETVTSDMLQNATVTVINEWAEWCGPCMNEMPHFQALHEYYSETPEADVQFLGSYYGTNANTAANTLNSLGVTWPSVIEDTVLAQVFNTSDSIPQTIIVDKNGVVRDHVVGSFPSVSQLRSFIEGWLEILSAEEPGDPTVLGDANGDGAVDSVDALLVLRYAMGIIDELANFEAADVNHDGSVNATDALLVLRAAMGLITLG